MIADGSCTNPYCKCPNCKCDPCLCTEENPTYGCGDKNNDKDKKCGCSNK